MKKEKIAFFHFSFLISHLFLFTFFCFIFLTASCTRYTTKQDHLLIAVSIPPQAWFVSKIAGEKAQSLILVPPGQNPHSYEPTPRQIQGLTSAGAWILSGSEFEITLLPKISALFPNLLIVDGTKGVQFRQLEDHNLCDCDEHSIYSYDTHTWLGREPAKILATHIKDTLCLLDAENEAYYKERYESLVLEIDEVFDELVILLTPLKGKNVFVYHPSFGYFLDEFGINQQAVETGGKEPGPRELSNLISKINEEKAAAVFVQSQFPASAVRSLAAATGVELISLDPLTQDWLDNIRSMGQALNRLIKE